MSSVEFSAAEETAAALSSFVIAMLYFARDVLIPLALGGLPIFLFAPLVSRIERWLGRVAAVLVVVATIFAATGAVGWVLTRQVIDLATKLPDYKENIVCKLHAFRLPKGGAFSAFSQTVEELKRELSGGSADPNTLRVTQEPWKAETPQRRSPATGRFQVLRLRTIPPVPRNRVWN